MLFYIVFHEVGFENLSCIQKDKFYYGLFRSYAENICSVHLVQQFQERPDMLSVSYYLIVP